MRSITFRFVGVWILTGLPWVCVCIYIYIYIYIYCNICLFNSDLHNTWYDPELLDRKYWVGYLYRQWKIGSSVGKFMGAPFPSVANQMLKQQPNKTSIPVTESRVTGQVVGCGSPTAEASDWSQTSLHGTFGGQSNTGTFWSLSTSGIPRHFQFELRTHIFYFTSKVTKSYQPRASLNKRHLWLSVSVSLCLSLSHSLVLVRGVEYMANCLPFTTNYLADFP